MNDAINQHKRMAMGDTPNTGGNFGIEPLSNHKHSKSHPDNGKKSQRATMRDGGRGARPPIGGGKGRNQAAPDHGPYDYMS